VTAGLKIIATADIIISGTVEASVVCAGGDIIVKNGIIGHGELRNKSGGINTSAAIISAGKSIQAKFIERAFVKSGASIIVDDHVAHSELQSIGQITVGKKNSKNGNIIGGVTQSALRIEAQTFGSKASIKTIIEAGGDPEIRKGLQDCKNNLLLAEKERDKIVVILNHIRTHPGVEKKEMEAKALITLEKIDIDINELNEKQVNFEIQLANTKNAKIIVGKNIFNNVSIKIGNTAREITGKKAAGILILKDDEVFYDQ